LNRLAFKIPAILIVLVLVLAGAAWFLFTTSIKQGNQEMEKLRRQMKDLEAVKTELAGKLAVAQAAQATSSAAARAAEALDGWANGWMNDFKDPALLKALGVATVANWNAQAQKLLEKGGPTLLDNVVVANARGTVSASAPKGSVPARSVWMGPVALRSLFARRLPRTEVRTLASGVPALTVSAPFYGGPKKAGLGVVTVTATFANLLKDALGAVQPGVESGLVVTDMDGYIMQAPEAALVRQKLQESPLKALAELAEGGLAVVKADGTREAHATLRTVAAGGVPLLRVYAFTYGPAAAGAAAGAAGTPAVPGSPIVPFAAAAAAVAIIAVLVVLGPVHRMRALTAAAQALSQGAAAVELRSSNAKDEVGDLARMLEKLGEDLAAERAKRGEGEGTIAVLQKDLAKVQAEARELTEFQKDLESRSRREKETLEADVAAARQEIEGARSEMSALRTQGEEKDRAMAAAGTKAAEQVAAIQAQVEGLRRELAATQAAARAAAAEAASRPVIASPVEDFTLFSGAVEALSGEISMLLEAVQGYMGRIIESGEGGINDEQQEFLTTVINRSARAQRHLGDMRDFAGVKMPGGLALGPVDIGDALTDITTTIQQAAEDKGLEMNVDVPANLPTIEGDEARLRQVVTVILQNSVRFTSETGKVSVSSAPIAEGGVEIRIEDTAEQLEMTAEEVFGKFHTADEENFQVRASGMRYPLLRSIVQAHGGSIEVSAGPSGGNLFVIRLPASTAKPLAKAPAFGAAEKPSFGTFESPASKPQVPPSFEEFLAAQAAAPAAAAPVVPEGWGAAPPAAEPAMEAGGFDWGALPDISAAAPAGEPAVPAAPDAGLAASALSPVEGPAPAEPPMFSLEGPMPEPPSSFDAAPPPPPAPDAAAPGFDSLFSAPETLDSIFNAPAAAPDAPAPGAPDAPTPDAGLGLWNFDPSAAPPAEPPAAPAELPAPDSGAPPDNTAFGHDEIIQE